MDWYKILQMVLEILVPAVIGLGVLIAKKYLSDKVKDDTLREGLNDAIDLLGRAARDTNQTYVDAIKNSGNGLTPEQAAIARQKTKELFEQLVYMKFEEFDLSNNLLTNIEPLMVRLITTLILTLRPQLLLLNMSVENKI